MKDNTLGLPSSTFLENPTPAKPLTLSPLDTLHTLYYLHSNNPRSQSINFQYNGSFKEAINRGRTFCEKMGWRFLKVEPFLTDLDDREKRAAAANE